MNLEFNKNSEIVFVLIISTILALFGIYYFQFIIFLYQVLFVVLGVRRGLKYSLMDLAASAAIIGLIVDILYGILIFAAFIPLTFIMINMIKRRKNSTIILIISTIVFLLSISLIINFVNMNGINIIGQLKGNIAQIINSQMDIFSQLNLSDEEFQAVKDLHGSYLQSVLAVVPSIVMIFSLVVSYLNYLLSTIALRRLGYPAIYIPKFLNFKLPRNIFLGLTIMFFTTFLLNYFNLINFFEVILNLIVLTFFIFFIQGISVVDYILDKKNIRSAFRIFILWLIIDLMPIFGIFILILGLLDVIFDFRKIGKSY